MPALYVLAVAAVLFAFVATLCCLRAGAGASGPGKEPSE